MKDEKEMFRVGIIEESMDSKDILCALKKYFVSQRIENVPEDESPVWHINEYHVPAELIEEILEKIKEHVKTTWYCHAFNNETLLVILKGKWFNISLKKDETWNEMIEYGVAVANVERSYLETIPLHI